MSLPNPGRPVKKKRPKIKPPKEKYCRGLFIETGEKWDDPTCCWRHIEVGWWKHRFGKGWGVKVDDRLTAWLGERYDRIYSTKPEDCDIVYHELDWLRAIILSHME